MFLLIELLECRQTARVQELYSTLEQTLSTNSHLHDNVVREVQYYLEHEQYVELDEYHERQRQIEEKRKEIQFYESQLVLLDKQSLHDSPSPFCSVSTAEMVDMIEQMTTRCRKPNADRSLSKSEQQQLQNKETQTHSIATLSSFTQTSPKNLPLPLPLPLPIPLPLSNPPPLPLSLSNPLPLPLSLPIPISNPPLSLPLPLPLPNPTITQPQPQMSIPELHLPPPPFVLFDDKKEKEEKNEAPIPILFNVRPLRKASPFHISEDMQKKLSENVRQHMNIVRLRSKKKP